MTSSIPPFRTETLARPTEVIPSMTVDVPTDWVPTPPTDAVISGFLDDGGISTAYRSNIVFTASALPADAELEAWQVTLRRQQLASLPDLHILDDRRLQESAEDPSGDQWYFCSTMTDRSGATVLTRRWNRMLPELGLTLTLTTLPLLDAEHGEMFDAIAASWTLAAAATTEATDDHA